MFNYDYYSSPRTDIAPPGQSILLIGTALNGPVNEPVLAASPAEAELYFGAEGTLVAGYRQAYQVNPRANIYLMRATGDYSQAVLWALDEDLIFAGLRLRALAGGQRYNGIVAEVTELIDDTGAPDGAALIIHPVSAALSPRVYRFSDYPILGLLVKAINDDAAVNLVEVNANTDETFAASQSLFGFNHEPIALTGGADGLDVTKNELYEALTLSYSLLGGRSLDVIVPLGAYFDDIVDLHGYGESTYGEAELVAPDDYLSLLKADGTRATFHEQLIEFCRGQQRFGIITHGVIGMRLLPDPQLLDRIRFSYIRHLLANTALATRDGLKEGVGGHRDLGYCISIVANDLSFNGGVFSSWAAAYGAHILACQLNTTTNTLIAGNPVQRVAFSDQELRALAQLGVVAPRYSVKQQGLVVAAGVTPSLPSSPLHSIANVRSIQYTLFCLQNALERFTGDTTPNLGLQGIIEESIQQCLTTLVNLGVLNRFDYSFQIEPRVWQGGRWGRLDLTLGSRHTVDDIVTSTSFLLSTP